MNFYQVFRIILTVIFSISTMAAISQVNVSGEVKLPDNTPAVGASIVEKGTKNGTITDEKGKYGLSLSTKDAILIFSYVGMTTLELNVDGRSIVNITLKASTLLDEIVITASQTSTPKLQTITSVETVGIERLDILKPESYSEALQNLPGVSTINYQGRRNIVRLRGFPDGTATAGMVYTAVLLDGIPTFASPANSPDLGFAFDDNIARIELVKGSVASLYGRGASAGVINLITKTGGDKLGGSARLTIYDDATGEKGFNERLDFNLNGPITDNIRFNFGGWQLNDAGFRNTGYNDKGYQIRGNVDFLFPSKKGSFRVYGQYADFNFQYLTDVAVDANSLKLAEGWKNTDTYYFRNANEINYKVYSRNANTSWNDEGVRNFGNDLSNGAFTKGYHVGGKLKYNLGNGFEITDHIRYQKIETGTNGSVAVPSFYNPEWVMRILVSGGDKDSDIINDLKITKTIKGNKTSHNLSAGFYISGAHILPTRYSFVHGSTTDVNNLLLIHPVFGTPVTDLSNPVDFSFDMPGYPANPIRFNGLLRRGDYMESVTAFSVGDELKIGEKLNLLLGLRYDLLNIDMKETKFPADIEISREEDFADWSGTIGFNYLLNSKSAIYGNVNRAFRMLDYSAFASLEWKRIDPVYGNDTTLLRLPDGVEDNEIIYTTELGYRNSIKDFSFNAAVFFTQINNRLMTVFENGQMNAKPLGDNRILGGEIALTYQPRAIKGLSIQTSYTYQNATFTSFKIQTKADPTKDLYGNTIEVVNENVKFLNLEGNRLPEIPLHMFNLLVDYNHRYFGVNFGYNLMSNRYQDVTNILEMPDLTNINAGVHANLKIGSSNARIGIQVKNLTNEQSLVNIGLASDNDTILLRKQGAESLQGSLAQGYIQLPRRAMVYFSYTF